MDFLAYTGDVYGTGISVVIFSLEDSNPDAVDIDLVVSRNSSVRHAQAYFITGGLCDHTTHQFQC